VTSLVGTVGRRSLAALEAWLRVSVLIVDTLTWIMVQPFRGQRLRVRAALEALVEFGVRSIPIVGMITFLIGVILALQASYTLSKWGANRYIAVLVAVSALRELAPLMTAVLITGRCGSAITAEIGTMKVGGGLDALEVMGLDPIRFLVAPKLLGMVVAVPCVTLVAMLLMITGGWAAGTLIAGVDSAVYLHETANALVTKDLTTGLTKSLFFALVICWVGVYRGFQVEGGAEGVGRKTTSSVVTSIFIVIVVDLVLTVLFYLF